MGESYATLAAVDLGSNSFRLQIARVVGDQLYPLDSLREPVRLAAGLGPDKRLDPASQERALACLRRFGERLRGLPAHAVRAVGTNTLRVAKNAGEFLRAAQQALGFPIEVVAGREEARLIYLGVAHELPVSEEKRLVVDIGGGSTELIIGRRWQALKLESLYMGCVSWSLRFFSDGRISKAALKEAELAARAELATLAAEFGAGHWQVAYGASGTVRAVGDMLAAAGMGTEITPEGMEWLREALLKAGEVHELDLPGLRPDRAPVLPGGFAILSAVLSELGIRRLTPAAGALREGVLYDLLGRFHHQDMRDVTVNQFMQRYHVDAPQARRVAKLARSLAHELLEGIACDREEELKLVDWAAKLHEVGISVAHGGYHKHSAYILRYADMPGFSRREQERLSQLVLGHRGSLKKMQGQLAQETELLETLALRLAALVHRNRQPVDPPSIHARRTKEGVQVLVPGNWLTQNPLTARALEEERREWRHLDLNLEVLEQEAALRAAS
jgi:exopolyphosphatase/guanosine-5'-triphosphate,3'-diphosphate pyrophosphatase